MSWWSDIFGGENRRVDRRAEGAGQSDRSRIAQLREGVESAAAALDPEHSELARDVTGVAEAVAEGAGARPDDDASSPGEESAGSELPDLRAEVIEELGELHFDVIRVEVEDADPDELGIPDRIARLRDLTERLERAAGGSGGASP